MEICVHERQKEEAKQGEGDPGLVPKGDDEYPAEGDPPDQAIQHEQREDHGSSTPDEDSGMSRDRRQKRDLHALNQDGMVLCNPRDKEAAHRAEMEGIATEDATAVTCRKCLDLLHEHAREKRAQ